MGVLSLLTQRIVCLEDQLSCAIAVKDRHIDIHEDEFVVFLTACLHCIAFVSLRTKLSILSSYYLDIVISTHDHLERHHIVEVILTDQDSRHTTAALVRKL